MNVKTEYLLAKARLDAIHAETARRTVAEQQAYLDALEASGKNSTPLLDAAISALIAAESAIETELGWHDAFTAWCDAEGALITWAFQTGLRIAQNDIQRTTIQDLQVRHKYHPQIKDKLIGLALRLEVQA